LDSAHIKRGGVKTGKRRKIPVNDNKNETTELDGHIMRGDSLQR